MVTLLERNRVSQPRIYTMTELQGYLKHHLTDNTQKKHLDSERYTFFSPMIESTLHNKRIIVSIKRFFILSSSFSLSSSSSSQSSSSPHGISCVIKTRSNTIEIFFCVQLFSTCDHISLCWCWKKFESRTYLLKNQRSFPRKK